MDRHELLGQKELTDQRESCSLELIRPLSLTEVNVDQTDERCSV